MNSFVCFEQCDELTDDRNGLDLLDQCAIEMESAVWEFDLTIDAKMVSIETKPQTLDDVADRMEGPFMPIQTEDNMFADDDYDLGRAEVFVKMVSHYHKSRSNCEIGLDRDGNEVYLDDSKGSKFLNPSEFDGCFQVPYADPRAAETFKHHHSKIKSVLAELLDIAERCNVKLK